jgi:hypothetical protein
LALSAVRGGTRRAAEQVPIAWHVAPNSTKNKSLFASFSSEKEESFFF